MESPCSKVLYYTVIQVFIFHPRIYKIHLKKKQQPNSAPENCVFSPLFTACSVTPGFLLKVIVKTRWLRAGLRTTLSLINHLGFSALCGIMKGCFQELYILAHV